MRRRGAARRLRIELLRTRAAADRLDLALALRDIGAAARPLRRKERTFVTVARIVAAVVLGLRGFRSASGITPIAALLGLGWIWRRLRRKPGE